MFSSYLQGKNHYHWKQCKMHPSACSAICWRQMCSSRHTQRVPVQQTFITKRWYAQLTLQNDGPLAMIAWLHA